MAGLDLYDWQQHVLRAGLGERRDGNWASFEVVMIVPRQNGKSVVLEAVELAAMFVFGESLILHSAHEFKTARQGFTRILSTIENCDYLRRKVRKVRTSHGEEAIELRNGSELRFIARSTGSGRGFTGDRVVLDEAYNLTAEALGALLPTLSARPNPQLWYASSAGRVDSVQLARLRERGLAGSDGLCYLEWSAPERSDLDDREAWAQANPILGQGIAHDFVANERNALTETEFARERLGIWEDTSTVAVIDPDTWASLADKRSQPRDPLAFALDVSNDRRTASIAVAGRREDGRTHLEIVDHRPGTAWVVERVKELCSTHGALGVVIDGFGSSAALMVDLEAAGVTTVTASTRDYANACARFYDSVINGEIRHLDTPLLNVALNQARKRPLGDAWAWQRRDVDADITPVVAVTLALHGLVALQPEKPKRTGKVW